MHEAIKNYFNGMKLRHAFPVLNEIAKQNGLKLNHARELRIAMRIMADSIVKN
jgi:hypothetical protein